MVVNCFISNEISILFAMVSHAHKVSQKGQIVVPAKFRRRLRIAPKDIVNFRIRGQILIVEKSSDIAANIDFLYQHQGNFGENFLTNQDIKEIISDLLFQQFYKGDNYLTDRMNQMAVRVSGAEAILDEVIKILVEDTTNWLNGNYTATLQKFAEDLNLDFPTLLEEFTKKVEILFMASPPVNRDLASIIFSLAVGETFSEFRTRIGDIVTERLIKEAIVEKSERMHNEDFTGGNLSPTQLEEIITEKLTAEYSLLLNLRVLKELARVTLKTVGEKKFNEMSQSLFDDLFVEKTEPSIDSTMTVSNNIPDLPDFDF